MPKATLDKNAGGWTLKDEIVINTKFIKKEWKFDFTGVTSHIENPEKAVYIDRFLVMWSKEVTAQWNKKITKLKDKLKKLADEKDKEIEKSLKEQRENYEDQRVRRKSLDTSVAKAKAEMQSKVKKEILDEVEKWFQTAHDDTEKAMKKGKDPYTPAKKTSWKFKKNTIMCAIGLTTAAIAATGITIASGGIALAVFAILVVAVGVVKAITKGCKAVKELQKTLEGSFKSFGREIDQIDMDLGKAISAAKDMSNAIDAIEMNVRQCVGDGNKFVESVYKVAREDWGPLEKAKKELLNYDFNGVEKFLVDLNGFKKFEEDLIQQRIGWRKLLSKYEKAEPKWQSAGKSSCFAIEKGEKLASAIVDHLTKAAP